MAIVRWEPFREMMSLRDAMDKLFEESFTRYPKFVPEMGMGEFPVDIYQAKDSVVVKASLPGVKPEEVDVSIIGDVLTIKGEHKEDTEVKEENYLRKEHRYGAFSRSVLLPQEVKGDKAEAVFADGVLTLTIPKPEEAKPKQIKVKTKAEKAIENKK